MLRRILAVSAGIAAAAVMLAPSAGAVPKGQGLQLVPEEITCEGLGVVEVLAPRGGNSAWVLDTGAHVVIKSFAVSGTFTPELGDPVPVDEFQSFGQKKGLGEAIACTFTIDETAPGEGTFRGEGTVEVVVVPRQS